MVGCYCNTLTLWILIYCNRMQRLVPFKLDSEFFLNNSNCQILSSQLQEVFLIKFVEESKMMNILAWSFLNRDVSRDPWLLIVAKAVSNQVISPTVPSATECRLCSDLKSAVMAVARPATTKSLLQLGLRPLCCAAPLSGTAAWQFVFCPTKLHICQQNALLATFSLFAQTPPSLAQDPFAQPSTFARPPAAPWISGPGSWKHWFRWKEIDVYLQLLPLSCRGERNRWQIIT